MTILADDPNDDFMPARPQCYHPSSEDPDDPDHADDDPDHADDDWQRMNRNFSFQPFY